MSPLRSLLLAVVLLVGLPAATVDAADAQSINVSQGGSIVRLDGGLIKVVVSKSGSRAYLFRVAAVVMLEVDQPDRPGGTTIIHLQGGHTVTIPKRIVPLEDVIAVLGS